MSEKQLRYNFKIAYAGPAWDQARIEEKWFYFQTDEFLAEYRAGKVNLNNFDNVEFAILIASTMSKGIHLPMKGGSWFIRYSIQKLMFSDDSESMRLALADPHFSTSRYVSSGARANRTIREDEKTSVDNKIVGNTEALTLTGAIVNGSCLGHVYEPRINPYYSCLENSKNRKDWFFAPWLEKSNANNRSVAIVDFYFNDGALRFFQNKEIPYKNDSITNNFGSARSKKEKGENVPDIEKAWETLKEIHFSTENKKLLKNQKKDAPGDYITKDELQNYAKQNLPPKIIPEEFVNFKDFVKRLTNIDNIEVELCSYKKNGQHPFEEALDIHSDNTNAKYESTSISKQKEYGTKFSTWVEETEDRNLFNSKRKALQNMGPSYKQFFDEKDFVGDKYKELHIGFRHSAFLNAARKKFEIDKKYDADFIGLQNKANVASLPRMTDNLFNQKGIFRNVEGDDFAEWIMRMKAYYNGIISDLPFIGQMLCRLQNDLQTQISPLICPSKDKEGNEIAPEYTFENRNDLCLFWSWIASENVGFNFIFAKILQFLDESNTPINSSEISEAINEYVTNFTEVIRNTLVPLIRGIKSENDDQFNVEIKYVWKQIKKVLPKQFQLNLKKRKTIAESVCYFGIQKNNRGCNFNLTGLLTMLNEFFDIFGDERVKTVNKRNAKSRQDFEEGINNNDFECTSDNMYPFSAVDIDDNTTTIKYDADKKKWFYSNGTPASVNEAHTYADLVENPSLDTRSNPICRELRSTNQDPRRKQRTRNFVKLFKIKLQDNLDRLEKLQNQFIQCPNSMSLVDEMTNINIEMRNNKTYAEKYVFKNFTDFDYKNLEKSELNDRQWILEEDVDDKENFVKNIIKDVNEKTII